MKYVIFLLAAFGFSSAQSFAHNHEGGPCKTDRETLCKDVQPGEGRIAKCMKENEAKLSEACKAHKTSMKSAFSEVKEACHDDVETLCEGVKPGRGAVMKCLKANKEKVSEGCKAEVEQMKGMRKKTRG